jgi:hypothetical protein
MSARLVQPSSARRRATEARHAQRRVGLERELVVVQDLLSRVERPLRIDDDLGSARAG